MKQLSIFYISRIIYPKYNPVWFLLYMYFKYYSILKRQIRYSIQTLSDDVLWNLLRNSHKQSTCDINNCVVVHPDNIYPGDRMLAMYHDDTKAVRRVVIVPDLLCEQDKLYISSSFFYNDFLRTSDCNVKLVTSISKVQFAEEIELSLIACPHEISNVIIDAIIEGYFKLPKLVRKGDMIPINVRYFCKASFYANYKLNSIENLYFKCQKVTFGAKEVSQEHFCAIGQTSIKQLANIQSFIPKATKLSSNDAIRGLKCFYEINVCPYGLESYLRTLSVAINPFLNTKNVKLRPIFLMEGEEGSGREVLINSLALQSGMHHFKINNSDLSANMYAQNESKLNNMFFAAKMSAPCIISIHMFENFGKNAEGQYDQRLIKSFVDCLDNLFENNQFPVILFCSTNSKDIAPELKRVFLEVFDIHAPKDTEREQILKWVIEKNNIALQRVDLEAVSHKTRGFYFEDLQALVHYAECNFYRTCKAGDKVVLDDEHFEEAIDFMQSNYNKSLGAPKVPKVQWSDVGGLNDVKNEIIRAINLPLRHPEVLKNSGLTRSGILLFGPPGTGKTLIAKAVATECSLCFLTVKGPELLNMYVGQSEQNIRAVFERARQASPCIIFFDELDSLAPNRGLSGDSGGVMDRVVSQLLAEMDGLDSTGKVFIIGATNRPDLIDPALLRPGRFDKLLYVGPCIDLGSKTSVLQALTRKFNLSEEIKFEELVKMCPKNMSGADFYGICSNAWTSAAKRRIEEVENGGLSTGEVSDQDVVVNVQDLTMAIRNVKSSISEADLKYFEELNKELSYSENIKNDVK